MNGNVLQTIAGVLSADATNSATIPVNDNNTLGGQSYTTGYAVANPGSEDVNIRITVLNTDGSVWKILDPPLLNPLKPGTHVARFLWQDLNDPNIQFRGSMVLTTQSARTFAVVALVMNQSLFTAIPVIPAELANTTPTANMFAQVAVGGGFSTTFTLMNTSTATASGNLILAGSDGMPLTVAFASPGQASAIDSSFAINVPPGGTQLIMASAVNPSDTSIGRRR
jgi:hypothetical protein